MSSHVNCTPAALVQYRSWGPNGEEQRRQPEGTGILVFYTFAARQSIYGIPGVTLSEGFLIRDTAAAAKSNQSCPTLCGPIDSSPPGSPVPGILPARTLEWVAISFSNAWKWKVKVKSLSRVRPSATPWTAAFQAPPSMGFSRQEYWSGVIPLYRYTIICFFIHLLILTGI